MSALVLAVVWTITGLSQPESAVLDEAAGALYISNVNGRPSVKDGNGFITKADAATGKVIKLKWAEGLDSPTGLALCGGKLYAVDVDTVVVLSLATGKIERRIPAPGAKFLNDVAADKTCGLYVSDMFASALFKSAGSELRPWMEGPELQSPNGLELIDGRLAVAQWGLTADGSTKAPGKMIAVDLAKQTILPLNGPHGNLDGLRRHKDGWLVTDHVQGTLLRASADGSATVLMRELKGPGDVFYSPARDLVILPEMGADRVAAYRLTAKRP